ncbi:MAG: protein kinase [Myxococcota bacterium]
MSNEPTVPGDGHSGNNGGAILELSPGSKLGRYRVLRELGRGAMGIVVEAEDPELDRTVAIKIVRSRELDPAEQLRMKREARAMAAVSHANVVAVLDVGEFSGRLFVAMEYVQGRTLAAWLDGKNEREILEAFSEAARGLAAVHAAGLVHGDFKPDNVLVGEDGRVRVTDFGLVSGTATQGTDDDSFESGVIAGTPRYMAPEQASGLGTDARSDQYSFSVAVFEALYGVAPYEGRTLMSRVAMWADRKVTKVEPRHAGTSCHTALLRGLDPEPGNRFEDMDALLEAMVPRRRSRAVLGLAVAAGLGVAGGLWALRDAEAVPCADRADNDVQAVWTDARRESIRANAAATVGGEGLWKTGEAHLDQAFAQWRQARVDLCAAELSPSQRDAALLCMRRRYSVLSALTTSLAHAERDAIAALPWALGGLDPVTACADAASRADGRAPDVPELDQELADVQALRVADPGACGERARAARARAKAAAACALEAEFGIESAMCLRRSGQPTAADEALKDAYYTAHECGAFAQAAEASTRLFVALGAGVVDPEKASEWLRHAQAAADRSGSQARQLGLAMARARVAAAQGTKDLGPFVSRARELLRARSGDDPLREAELDRLEATSLRRQSRFDEALLVSRRALAHVEEAVGETHPKYALLLAGIGSAEAQRGDLDAAAATMQRVVALIRMNGATKRQIASLLANLAVVRQRQGRYSEALAGFDRALAQIDGLPGIEFVEMRLHSARARALGRLGRLDDARTASRRALELHDANAFDNELELIAVAGEIELLAGDAARAVALVEAACSSDADACDARPLVVLGQGQLALGDRAAAIATLKRAYAVGPVAEIQLIAPLPPAIAEAVGAPTDR